MSENLPAGVLPSQIARLDEIQNALNLLMRELYEHIDERDDPAPTHSDCYAWADGISWLAQSVGRVRDTLKGPQS